jgi:antitoxin HigA-1
MIKGPVHPGTILLADVLEPLALSISEAARRLGVSRVRLSRTLNGRIAITARLALRLEKAGVGRADAWVRLQADYDLWIARKMGVKDVKPLVARLTSN